MPTLVSLVFFASALLSDLPVRSFESSILLPSIRYVPGNFIARDRYSCQGAGTTDNLEDSSLRSIIIYKTHLPVSEGFLATVRPGSRDLMFCVLILRVSKSDTQGLSLDATSLQTLASTFSPPMTLVVLSIPSFLCRVLSCLLL